MYGIRIGGVDSRYESEQFCEHCRGLRLASTGQEVLPGSMWKILMRRDERHVLTRAAFLKVLNERCRDRCAVRCGKLAGELIIRNNDTVNQSIPRDDYMNLELACQHGTPTFLS